jgi:SHS2 domain-containing protein
MKYRYLANVAISDCAFEAFGKNERELLENSAEAIFGEMAVTKKVPLRLKKKIVVFGDSLERVLYNFLAEIILLKDKENMVFGKITVRIKRKKNNSDSGAIEKKSKGKNESGAGTGKKETKNENGNWNASALLWGEKVERLDNKTIRRDVKAVTWHLFRVERKGKRLKATVVLDI